MKYTDPGLGPAKFLLPLAVLLAALAVFLPTIATEDANPDSYAASASAWRIATTGLPWMDDVDQYEMEGSIIPGPNWTVTGADGHLVHSRSAGVVLAGVPFYWLLNNTEDPRSYQQWTGGVAAATLSAVAVMLLFLALRRVVSPSLALVVTAAYACATPVWTISANSLWTHTVTQLGLAGAIWAMVQGRWLLAGSFLGLGLFGRPHLAIIAAVLGLGIAWRRRDASIAFRVGAPSGMAFLAYLTWNYLIFGDWSPQGGYPDYVVPDLPQFGAEPLSGLGSLAVNYLGFVVSPNRGLLVWTPILLLLMPALVANWRSLPDWSRWLCYAGVAYTVAQLSVNGFSGGVMFYGYRHGLELLSCLTPALALSVRATGTWVRTALGPILGLQFAAIALGATVNGFYRREDRVWTDNSFWLALRTQPIAVGSLTATCVLVGLALSLYWVRSRPADVRDSGPTEVIGSVDRQQSTSPDGHGPEADAVRSEGS